MLSQFFHLSEEDKIKIKVKLSAYYREIVGKKELNMELKEKITVNELMKMLVAEYPKLSEFTDYTMILLNHVYSDGTELIEDGDEIALFPPLDGG
ncbi:MAG: MoaD/ThiS family protein [Methanomicrobia archaeon]|nr:MoaD/ThiS family protein [Methanomicrobia archaeon]RLF94763.1 MAG: molybdopterin synthase sulfur carrier subunit [Thermococci archaeon]RLF94971.1 MAG: molybdopterin synthase sulfur carrier subunit [Thermococci archaeon]RLG01200.1 MAG: molybdopterin synthase sulfur carrier subunit [Thermococci archaeon]HEC95971.1 MoaD/ThiS family protein [Euryarchaeota archaeon]